MKNRRQQKYGILPSSSAFAFYQASYVSIIFCVCASILLQTLPVHADEVWYEPYEEGIKDFQSGNLSVAEGKFLRAIQLKPHPEKNAKKYGQRFIEYVPQYYLAAIYYRQGKDSQAEQQLAILSSSGVLSKTEVQQRLKKDGVDLSRSKESEILVARIQDQLKQRRLGEAEKALNELKTKFPKDANLQSLQATLASSQEAQAQVQQARQMLETGRLADAETALKQASKLDPSHPDISRLSDQLSAKQDAEKLIARATELNGKGQLDPALDSLKAAEAKDPTNPRIASLRSQILQEQKTRLAQTKKTESFETLLQQAGAASKSNRFSEARSFLSQAQATGINSAKVAEQRKAVDAAESDYLLREGENAIRNQDFSNARQFGKRIQEMGIRMKEATQLMRKIDSAESLGLIQRGQDELRAGNLLKAQDLASRALQMNGQNSQAKDLIRKIRVRQELDAALHAAARKDWKNAQFHALEVQKLDPENPELAKLMAALQKKEAPPPPQADPLAQQRDTALLAYFTGDYEKAAKILTDVNKKVKTTNTLFYLACSNAALALMQGSEGKELMTQATKQFAMVKELEPDFKVDSSLISPRIVRIYQQAQ